MIPAYVWSQSAWMPGRAGAGAVLEQSEPDAAHQRVDISSFPSRLMRGTSPTTRSLAWVARDAVRQTPIDDYVAVFGSAYGEVSIAIQQLEMMVSGDGQISPTLFKNSVHNTATGVLSIADRNPLPSVALAAGELTVASALLEGMLQLDEGASAVVVAVGDEALPEPLSQVGSWPLFAAAWVLRSVPPPKPTVVFDAVTEVDEAAPPATEPLCGHPCRGAFTILDVVANRRAGIHVIGAEDDSCLGVSVRTWSEEAGG